MTLASIVTVTLNPALDLTAELPVLHLGEVNRVPVSSLVPAGKGVNVARVLRRLGQPITVSGLLGVDNDGSFASLFVKEQITDCFIRHPGATRINVKIATAIGEVTDINLPGFLVQKSNVESFEYQLQALSDDYDWFVFAGSLPQGIAPEQLNLWIKWLKYRGKRVIVDASGPALYAALDASPWMVKPNIDELNGWAGEAITSDAQLQDVAQQLMKDKGIEHLVVSRGSQGVVWFRQGEVLLSEPPRVEVVSTVGAGDTLLAGMLWGMSKQWSKERTLRFATALSAQAVTCHSVASWQEDELIDLQAKIKLKPYLTDGERRKE